MSEDLSLKTEMAIVGAGIVGLAAAISLHLAGFSVVLIDEKLPTFSSDLDSEHWDNRVYAISPKNAEWLKELGVWQFMNPTRIGEMQAMVISDHVSTLMLNADDANIDRLGFVIESNVLMQVLMQKVEELAISCKFDCTCTSLKTSNEGTKITLSHGEKVEASLLLAADGSRSWVRRALNMSVQQKQYKQTAIVANFEIEKAHTNIARQWFSHDNESKNSILAYLPLPGNRISIVWSVSVEYAEKLLALSEEAFTKQVKLAGDSTLGQMRLITQPVSFPLALQKTNTLMQDCVLLMGDAAHQIHPLAGQGMNLGFRDVIDFLNIIKSRHAMQTINDQSILRKYVRARKADTLKMILLTDGLFQLFENNNNVVKKIRELGLTATAYQPIKKILLENAIML